jgi:hypothetical protein
MKTISSWDDLRDYGIVLLTGEACSLLYRLLCDLTENGKRVVERCLGVQIASENWNSGPENDPHVASIMLTREMLVPLAVFALLQSGCPEVWVNDRAAIGVESDDSPDHAAEMKRLCKPTRRFAYSGPHQDRNQHQMTGRVR